MQEVKKMIEQSKISVEEKLGKGDSICHIAAQYGSIEIFKEFERSLVKNNFVNQEGDTWLHVAFR